MMRVLVGCEFSGVVREAFRARGHEAVSCDVLPAEDGSPHHLQMDVEAAIALGTWDLGIFHPPCTRLCNSGVRWLHERDLWTEMRTAAAFFGRLLDAPIAKIAVENPIMHRYAREIVGRRPDQLLQPWQFGHGEIKATGLWLKGLPLLTPTEIVEGRTARVHRESPGPDRWKNRSRTYTGIAAAMAAQWGED
jgi:hypothetical protein